MPGGDAVRAIRTGGLVARLLRAGQAAAQQAADDAAAALIEAAARELPEVAAARTGDGVELRGRSLRARAWGTRALTADGRLSGLALGVRVRVRRGG